MKDVIYLQQLPISIVDSSGKVALGNEKMHCNVLNSMGGGRGTAMHETQYTTRVQVLSFWQSQTEQNADYFRGSTI